MKVLHLADYYAKNPGSFIIALSSLIDHDVEEVFVLPVFRPWQEELRKKGAKIYILRAGPLYNVNALAAFLKIVRNERPNIIHAHYSLATHVYAALSKAVCRNIKVIWHWRNPPGIDATRMEKKIVFPLNLFYWVKEWIGNLLYGLLDRLLFVDLQITISDYIADIIRKRGMASSPRIKVLYNGIDTVQYDPLKAEGVRSEFGLADDDFVMCNVAHFRPQKDHATLLKSFKVVTEEYPRSKLLLIGDGPLRQQIINTISGLGLEENVIMLGERGDIRDILSISDIGILTSLYEGFGFFVAESLAMCRPVVCAGFCGVKNIVCDGIDGFIVFNRDPYAIAEKVKYFIRHPEERDSMGRAGREKILRKYSIDLWATNMKQVYNGIL